MDNEVIHRSEIRIAEYFVETCKKNNLRYCMLGGTLLGAIRHKGFIPWDDDMDFGMPREDYEKLFKILAEKNNSEYVFKNFKISDIKTYFSRIEDPSVMITDSSAIITDVRHAWIDIFPLDGTPNNRIIRKIYMFKVLLARLILQYSQFDKIVNQNLPDRSKLEQVLINIGNVVKPQKFLNTKKAFYRVDRLLRKYSYDESDFVGNHMGAYKFRETFKREVYDDLTNYQFEETTFLGPRDYDHMLTQLYGLYMVPPKDLDKNKHHTEIVKG